MKSFCNWWVSVRNPDSSKEIVRFVHEVHPVFAVTLSTFLHMLCGWDDDAMPSFNLFRVHLQCFSISGSFSSKQISKCMKIANEGTKGWKLTAWLWMVHNERKNVRSCNNLLKKLIAGVTDEFSFETLILRKRLCVLYTKCIQFLP